MLLAALLALSACGPSEQKKAELAEKKRLECLDKVCEGDVVPKGSPDEFVMKLNGQFFAVSRRYASGMSGLAFYWPSKTPLTGRPDGGDYPERGKNFSDVAIEIFLRSNNSAPPDAKQYDLLVEAQEKGQIIKKETLRLGLERWQEQDTSGFGPGYWYVATAYPDDRGRPPVVWCRGNNEKLDRCTAAFFIQPGIAADIRFRAQHASDWPEIYQEINRVIQLLRRV